MPNFRFNGHVHEHTGESFNFPRIHFVCKVRALSFNVTVWQFFCVKVNRKVLSERTATKTVHQTTMGQTISDDNPSFLIYDPTISPTHVWRSQHRRRALSNFYSHSVSHLARFNWGSFPRQLLVSAHHNSSDNIDFENKKLIVGDKCASVKLRYLSVIDWKKF